MTRCQSYRENFSPNFEDRVKCRFPFHQTSSGNLKVLPNQVVFESKKVSVLVADPHSTKVNVEEVASNSKNWLPKRSEIVSLPLKEPSLTKSLQFKLGTCPSKDKIPNSAKMEGDDFYKQKKMMYYNSSEEEEESYDAHEVESDILNPEIPLERLGITNADPFNWQNVNIHEKSDLYEELYKRISNYINPDITIVIGDEEFFCHLLVLQCYSKFFDRHHLRETENNITRVELPESSVTTKSFALTYDWMITPKENSHRCLKRTNVLDMYSAAKFLEIKELEEQCWMFIDSEEVFDEETAFLLYLEAKSKKHADVMQLMLPRIKRFFMTLVSSHDFLELSADEIVVLLSSNYIVVNCELEVLLTAIRWLRHDWETRRKYMVPVMNCVRFGMIDSLQLIDIKRNPENAEYAEMHQNPDVIRMVDDGLALVVIQGWYKTNPQEYTRWVTQLGLKEPEPRNWTGVEKNYKSYREFLEFLENHRQDAMMARTIPKPKHISRRERSVKSHKSRESAHRRKSISPNRSITNEVEPKIKPPLPTMLELLTERQLPSSKKTFTNKNKFTEHSIVNIYDSVADDTLTTHPISEFCEWKRKVMLQEYKYQERLKLEEHKLHMNILTEKLKDLKHSNANSGDKVSELLKIQEKSIDITNPKITNETPLVSLLSNNAQIKSKVSQKSFKATQSKNYLMDGSLFNSNRETVLVFGGIDPHSQYGIGRNTGKDVYRYLSEKNIWEFVTELPEPRHHHSVTFLKGRVYLIGGADPREDNFNGNCLVVDSVWSFDPVYKSWFIEPDLNNARKNFGLVVHRQRLFVIGGQDGEGRTLSSVERFDPNDKIWIEVSPLKLARMGVACTKYKDCIWVAGGMTNSKKCPLSNDVECYDIRSDQWTEITKLRFPRCFGCLFVMNDLMYLIGGAGRLTEKNSNTISLAAVDIWSTKDNQWQVLTEMSTPRHGHALAYIGSQILVIGGVTTLYMKALNNVECFCCETSKWIKGVAGLPTTLSGHSAATLPPASLM